MFALRRHTFMKPTLTPTTALLCSAVFLTAMLMAGPLQAATAVPSSTLTLTPRQVEALGVRTQVAAVSSAGAASRYPAVLLVPSSQQRVLAAPLPGLIESLRVSVGDSVRAGQVLAVLRSAQAQELQHDVHVARSHAALAAAALARDEKLFQEGLIAASRLESTRAQAGLADEHQEERQLALSQAGGAAQGAAGVLTLKAPISGVVLERPVVVGQRVEEAAALFRLAKLQPLWVELQVPVAEATSVRAGDVVRLVGRQGAEQTAQGKVIAVGHAVDAASQSVLVRAEIAVPGNDLRVGQAVEAQLERAAAGLVQLPAAALLEDAGVSTVFVMSAVGQYRSLPVQVQGAAGGLATVRGVPVGSHVVVQGMASLKSMRAASTPTPALAPASAAAQ